MSREEHQKVRASHLARSAYLYVRQSTLRQVVENKESTARQYALRQNAVRLGWSDERVVVIDCDLGLSGSSVGGREGFRRLMTDVTMGDVGIVMGLEVSRLARKCSDWHRLLEICAVTDTLILDEDGIYDPTHFNDRLLLGIKGAMSEAELHLLRARLRGGLINKARRGELRCRLPVGLLYDTRGAVVFDPDEQVQQSVRLVFDTFRQTGSIYATVKHFRKRGLLFPTRIDCGLRKGELAWGPLSVPRLANTLHNPWYAGTYAFSRTRCRKLPDGKVRRQPLPPGEWIAFIRDHHPSYISWQEYMDNQHRIETSKPHANLFQSVPREGPALLQGRVVCGLCGSRMRVQYATRRGEPIPNYVCVGRGRSFADPSCQNILGKEIDQAIGKLLIEAVSPMALEMTLAVQQEIERRFDEVDHLRQQQVERAQYEADLARQRYMQVDPANRLVADSLEAEWNDKLRALEETREDHRRHREADRVTVDDEIRRRVQAAATDFPTVWRDPKTPQRERKRLLALLVEDITLTKQREITAAVRFRGGATTILRLPRPLTAQQRRATNPEVRQQIDALLDEYTDAQVAHILNRSR